MTLIIHRVHCTKLSLSSVQDAEHQTSPPPPPLLDGPDLPLPPPPPRLAVDEGRRDLGQQSLRDAKEDSPCWRAAVAASMPCASC